jgi:ABC-2 type transport system permease protein/lipopolysaccharide transport system permease protein
VNTLITIDSLASATGAPAADAAAAATATAAIPDEPPRELRFHRGIDPRRDVGALWRHRELIWRLAERDLRARYKQALLGAGWAVVTPLALMIIFTAVFSRVARFDTAGAPYFLFAYLGLVLWTLFSSTVNGGGLSLVTNAAILNKVYCPREVFPIAAMAVALADFAVASGVMVLVFAWAHTLPKATAPLALVFLLMLATFMVGLTLALSAVVVYLRDLRHVLPLALQIGLFATPVAWPLTIVPAHLRVPYAILNPLGVAIDGFRRSLVGHAAPDWGLAAVAGVTSLVVLAGGYALFKRVETGLADVA